MADEAHDLNPLEDALRALKPASSGLKRDRLMFEAGKAEARRTTWVWPLTAAAALLVALVLSATLLLRDPPERVVYVQAVEKPEPMTDAIEVEFPEKEPGSRLAYLALRERVLRDGVDQLPPPATVPATQRPLKVGDLMH